VVKISDKYIATYKCGFCGCPFEKVVGSTGGGTDSQGRRIRKLSSQVVCPNCNNCLKTFDDSITLTEIKTK